MPYAMPGLLPTNTHELGALIKASFRAVKLLRYEFRHSISPTPDFGFITYLLL